MNGISVKEEDGIAFKSEMDYPLANTEDDDDYEDTGELTIPPGVPGLWLTRVPDYLWESLSGLNDDDEIEIGTIRIWEGPGRPVVMLQDGEVCSCSC